MKKYLVLYESSVSAMEQMANTPPEQAKAGMDLWMQWAEKARSGIVELGSPLGNEITVGAGSSGDGKSHLGGFSILQAESDDALRQILEGHPHLRAPGGVIKAFEFLQMPEM